MASNYIPDAVAFSILSKLPIKSIKRFQCVCKLWSLLFEDSCFMTKYGNNFLSNTPSYDGDTSLFMDLGDELYSLSGDRFQNKVKLNWPNPYSDENANFDITCFGGANGILCLSYYNFCDRRVVLWNPTTEKFKVIPPAPKHDQSSNVTFYGFGYDYIADDYKVFRNVKLYGPDSYNYVISSTDSWETYSLRSNSWRKFDVNMSGFNIGTVLSLKGHFQVYMNGMCHRVCEYFDRRELVTCLVSFDLNKEMVSITFVPSCDTLDWTQLTMLNGSVALVSSPKMATTLHISILGEIGVKESWIKLLIVEQPCIGFPIGVGMKGEIFIEKIDDHKLVWFDLTTKMIKELDLKGKRMGIYGDFTNANITIIIKNLTCTF